MKRMFGTIAVTAATAAVVFAPTAALAAPQYAAQTYSAQSTALPMHNGEVHGCEITGGTLTWGIKESFRAYITSIAAGGWEQSEDVTYETPLFTWKGATGEIDPETGIGSVSFPGSVTFSGHDDVLNLVISNPTLELVGDGTAKLLLDTTSNDMNGVLKIDEKQVYLGKVEGLPVADLTDGTYSFEDASAILTKQGADGFGGFYSSGEELDPLAVNLTIAECAGAEAGASDAAPTDQGSDDSAETEAAQEVPWVPIVIAGVAVLVIAAAAVLLLTGRKKTNKADSVQDEQNQPDE